MAEDFNPDLGRPQMYLFGCELKPDRREFKVKVDDDEAEHQLSLKAVCLGVEAEDKLHTVEIEGLSFEGKMSRVQLAVLKPSVLPSISLGGFEITPPITFRLKSGSGPVFISGQHFVSVKDSDNEGEEEEHNTSPIKRPSNLFTAKAPLQKKRKVEFDDLDEEEDEDDDDDDDEDDEEEEEEEESGKKLHKLSKTILDKAKKKV